MCYSHQQLGSENNSSRPVRPAGILSGLLYDAVRFYQKYISPLKMGSTCRFDPTCSAYALEAVSRRGAVVGTALTIARLAKCGPWHPGGYDPVPRR
ncbi:MULTISPECIES: membrane protein insertion efficiency factor YidD [Corynebacterium]|uniref:membrane protein insertion efficiency factor YidD n=1 Tax=Corynebacterium TaxID=1716 RepID=UPI0003C7AC38|nr:MULTISPECIES: membrane protein insertion efficiency factor YidD [Corynebacterium]ESU59146.1 preprotein translocase subunit [Corynebacterium ulcerans NCTC 12077]BDV27026.1 hypothetical protein CULTSU28_22740 [Corynebacterium ulcerans]STC80473.1 preprotein translocase subunit [Corynebacterium ulcerans]